MAYQVHHLNCGSMCMRSSRLFHGAGGWLDMAHMVCHCLLIETDQGLVLVDTGIGYKDLTAPTFPDSYIVRKAMGLQLEPERCAISQVRALGYSPDEVRHIVVTHLDPDHAGGLMDFPQAEVHLLGKELEAATDPMTLWEKARYRSYQWKHRPKWNPHRQVGERWFGFDAVQVLNGALYDILLVPLTGHSRGHCGVAVSTQSGWLLHCGDAYFDQREVAPEAEPSIPMGIHLLESMDDVCRAERISNQKRLRQLKRVQQDAVQLICSHDHAAFGHCDGCVHTLAKQPY